MDANTKPIAHQHILRPHHVVLLTLFMLVFREYDVKLLPQPFLLHIYRLLMNEVSEVAQPKKWKQLLKEVIVAPKAQEGEASKLIHSFRNVHVELYSTDRLSTFLRGIAILFDERSEDASRSLFGYFCRRCHISYLKLSWAGLVALHTDYVAWCTSEHPGKYARVLNDPLNSVDRLLFRTRGDQVSWPQPDPYEAMEKAHATGDELAMDENARRYFEQQFTDGPDSGLRQNVLLSLIRMHYLRHEFTAVRTILSEAISVSRIAGDKIILQHCATMLNRLPPDEEGKKVPLNELQPDLHPAEILFDVKKLLDINNEQPLTASFTKIVEAIGLYDYWTEIHPEEDYEAGQWGQHAVQSTVWSAAGCEQLAQVEENIVIAFTEYGGSNNNRLTAILNKAYRQARQGKYTQALVSLLEPDVWRGLTIDDYAFWAQEIWHILVLRAVRRKQDRLYSSLLLPRKPPGDYNSRHYILDHTPTPTLKIFDDLHEVIRMRACEQSPTAVHHLLTSLWHSEFLLRLNLYRTSIIMLADVGLELGLTKRSRRMLERIMPQLITGNDMEQRALASFTLARCIIAAEGANEQSLREASTYLQVAEADFSALEMYREASDAQYLCSVVFHNLGDERMRNVAARNNSVTSERAALLEKESYDEEVARILDTVALVGARLALR
ncbi:uncharacterized protein EV420DRAFT_1261755 [Desarmillaria tabescens]|uniref:Anaphase-promoting complex subunit 5 n=1 Tax=Armillaria tabescens TaxID=1929756 RepID=A0AA39NIV6_ARMTA|nr:uncharacterized protein EV420DRAFT_1261755 [Desarmillaria tabescens]KAK0466412.1 hypothetical protein EV420DRAFT_1261755 [Desarmillaria tabescens]